MSANGLPDVTGAPSIIIGGTTYTLRWSQLAQFELSEAGYSISEMLTAMKEQKPSAVAHSYRLFAAMLAHNFTDKGLPIPDARHWASVMPNDKVVEMFTAISDALGKAAAPAVALREPGKSEAEPQAQPS